MGAVDIVLYLLAILTSAACMLLLFRGYAASGVRLLLWSGLCFVFLTVNNVLLFVDLIVFEGFDLRLYRLAASLIAVSLLIYAFLWEAE